jgi:hypothetical protein
MEETKEGEYDGYVIQNNDNFYDCFRWAGEGDEGESWWGQT